MSESKELYVKKISGLLRKTYDDYVVIASKEEMTEEDDKKLREIVKTVKFIEEQKGIIKDLTGPEIIKINKLSFVVNELTNVFSYDLGIANNSPNIKSKRKNNNEGHNLIVKNFGLGKTVNRNTFNINDDVTNFVNDPIFSIEKQAGRKSSEGFIHELTDRINSEYKISFSFNLSRFPSKTFQNSTRKHSMKQITSRRTDLLKFNYGKTTIEFGAMAPVGIFVDPKQEFIPKESEYGVNKYKQTLRDILKTLDYKPYSQIYSQFSIACCINSKNGTTLSLSTDYKFELGKNYVVSLTINGLDGNSFRGGNKYLVKMSVNGVDEPIFLYSGKVWNKIGNRLKNNNKLPSQPNFRYRLLPKFVNDGLTDQYEIDMARKKIDDQIRNIFTHKDIYNQADASLNELNVNNLISIISVPYDKTGKNIYNKKTYKVNRGVSFRNIELYYR
jgi:hypothetical protein